MQQKGKITNWNDDKGFGFITPIGGGKQIFIHFKAFKNRSIRPEVNQIVSYDISKDKSGRTCANNASRLGDKKPKKTNKSSSTLSIIIVFVFSTFLVLSILATKMPALVLAVYFIVSLLTFIMYSVDKSAARNGDWRTPESTLHFLSLAGGWPGALIAQQKLRHKSKKQPFRVVFWGTVILNLTGFIWLLTPNGNAFLQSILINIIQMG
ncbi:DUF1294 domain-containing protein [sulfur-oxidizing endosymbiont of Gigantopelta aegis]|uniref:DUF1294 domain-containing protein n=1 Tax=sulfur-oxidizing endosymbiont of Gigantopelta aegis TaxID=2794934 RepID=UPI0018DCC782|nr:cold shock and DUF1294 domain-containing protein [sulfur-oxidizing endosymbiont of Gigantopelta aegis]